MKKALSVFLAIAVLICSSVITFASNSVNAREPDLELAYLDYDSATPEMKEKILAARNQIIFSTSWVADGYSASIGNVKTGEIIRVLPSFSELFPGWDIPVLAVPDVADNALPDESQSIMNPIIDPIDPDDWVGLTTTYYYLPAATNVPTNPFFSSYINSYTMGRVVRTYATSLTASETINIGYSNATTGVSLGYATELYPYDELRLYNAGGINLAVRASTYSSPGWSTIRIEAADRLVSVK